ncbi:hypothetical protein GCM10011612_09820 [Actinomyces gaoshouyii]|uniref:Uncharacterized protein n=1 Tax=Actinomyces gaoshouyii TaxID=1960083 RepID=A0A8H9HD03_9ACTO|nr:hypothetical protein GCM10011612_09820 [Actinomyces gaoshouyii]
MTPVMRIVRPRSSPGDAPGLGSLGFMAPPGSVAAVTGTAYGVAPSPGRRLRASMSA